MEITGTHLHQNTSELKTGLLRDWKLWLLCALAVVVGAMSLNYSMLYTPDSPRYIVWAQSLAGFSGFYDDGSVEPTRYVIHAPLYSLLLAPFALFFGGSILGAKIVTMLFGLATLILFYAWTRNKIGSAGALIAGVFVALNPLYTLFSTHILSDVAFAGCFTLFFLLVEKIVRENSPDTKQVWPLSLVLTAAMFLRELGITLVAATALFFFLRKEKLRALVVIVLPAFLYLLWYVRNEIIVAGSEDPVVRNTKLFFSHLYTTQAEGFTAELFARLQNNVLFYLSAVGRFVFFPHSTGQFSAVVPPTDFSMTTVGTLYRYLFYPLVILQIGLFGWGITVRWREEKTMPLLTLVVALYVTVLLVYPILDIRFLFPLLFLNIGYGIVGGKALIEKLKSIRTMTQLEYGVGFVLLAVLLFPNIAWTADLIRNNLKYAFAPKEVFEQRETSSAPEIFSRPFHHIGAWINGHADSDAVILTRWNDLAFWLNGKKLLSLDPLTPLDALENNIRDYNATYMVVLIGSVGIREFEYQMISSKRYAFSTVYRSGNLEVVRIKPALDADTVRLGTGDKKRELFRNGVRALQSGEYQAAYDLFHTVWESTQGSGTSSLYCGVALEFSDKLDEARGWFDRFRVEPQAGSFLKHAYFHQELTGLRERAQNEADKLAKARLYQILATNYWDLGFRYESERMLAKSLAADSSFMPSLIFGAYFRLQERDTVGAKKYSAALAVVDPANQVVDAFNRLFENFATLKHSTPKLKQVELRLNIAQAYFDAGLNENAIEELLRVVQYDPSHVEVLRALGYLFEAKKRYAPALKTWQQILQLDPNHEEAQKKVAALLER